MEQFCEALGAAVASMQWTDADAMVLAAAQDRSGTAYRFINGMTFIRRNVRTRVKLDDALTVFLNAVNTPGGVSKKRYTGYRAFFRSCFYLYVSLRHMAVPAAGRLKTPVSTIPMGRKDRSKMTGLGLVRARATSMQAAAEESLETTWRSIKNRCTVVWMDNFYKRRFGFNPTMTDSSLNATAFGVLLNTPTLGRWKGYGTLSQVANKKGLFVHSFLKAESALIAFIHTMDTGVQEDAIRVPLDVPRGKIVGPKWKGLTLEKFTTSSHEDLLKCFSLLQDIQAHTNSVMPLLADENIHYRYLKWMYSPTYAHLAVRESMGQIVLTRI